MTDLYAAFLRRTPDPAGLTTFVTALEQGTALEDVAAAILSSEEFARHCPGEFAPLGEFTLPGFSAAQLVFGLDD